MKNSILQKLGFKNDHGSVHNSRTIMLDELTLLFETVGEEANPDEYAIAVVDNNCLGKRSVKTRLLTYRHLKDLYGLNPQIPLFRALRYFWAKDVESRPLLALLSAFSRDEILHRITPYIIDKKESYNMVREEVEQYISEAYPDRYSPATITSTAQNVNSSLTKSGFLTGKVKKFRTKPKPGPGAVAFALFLGYITGSRGLNLFNSEFMAILDSSIEYNLEMSEQASTRGWIRLKRIGDVLEVNFPGLLSDKEIEMIYEQN